MTDTIEQHTPPTIEEQFKEIYNGISHINSNSKDLQLRVKDLAKSFKHACKPKKVKKHTVMHDPMNISKELLKYLGSIVFILLFNNGRIHRPLSEYIYIS